MGYLSPDPGGPDRGLIQGNTVAMRDFLTLKGEAMNITKFNLGAIGSLIFLVGTLYGIFIGTMLCNVSG